MLGVVGAMAPCPGVIVVGVKTQIEKVYCASLNYCRIIFSYISVILHYVGVMMVGLCVAPGH